MFYPAGITLYPFVPGVSLFACRPHGVSHPWVTAVLCFMFFLFFCVVNLWLSMIRSYSASSYSADITYCAHVIFSLLWVVSHLQKAVEAGTVCILERLHPISILPHYSDHHCKVFNIFFSGLWLWKYITCTADKWDRYIYHQILQIAFPICKLVFIRTNVRTSEVARVDSWYNRQDGFLLPYLEKPNPEQVSVRTYVSKNVFLTLCFASLELCPKAAI